MAQQGLDIGLDHALDNLQGQISSEGLLNARVGNLDNTDGKLSSVGALELASSAALVNRNGSITTDAGLLIHSQDLTTVSRPAERQGCDADRHGHPG